MCEHNVLVNSIILPQICGNSITKMKEKKKKNSRLVVDMERLTIRFKDGLPATMSRPGSKDRYNIPKKRRMETLAFMHSQPQHVLKKRATTWDVLGVPPTSLMKQRGGNNYNDFLQHVKKVMMKIPHHPHANSSIIQLQNDPTIKQLYTHHFKNNPQYINYASIRNMIASSLLNYNPSTGQVMGSVADARARQPRNTPSNLHGVELKTEHDFDTLLVHMFDTVLRQHGIPPNFLNSPHFKERTRLHQLYEEDPRKFVGAIEPVIERLNLGLVHDYYMFVANVNRIFLSKYPFRKMIDNYRLDQDYKGLSRKKVKLQQAIAVVPNSTTKYANLTDLIKTFSNTLHATQMNPDHFMNGLHPIMAGEDDEFFVRSIFKDSTRYLYKVHEILKGNTP